MAGPTRLELATSGVTGRRSNQLNYGPALVVLSCSWTSERSTDRFQRMHYRVNLIWGQRSGGGVGVMSG